MPRQSVHRTLKRIFRYVRWTAAIALDIYVAFMYFGLKSGRSDEWAMFYFLLVVAAFDTLVEVFEAWNDRFDESEIASIHAELAAMKAPRTISDAGKEILKNALARYAPQNFYIIQVGYGDREAVDFTNLIASILRECGWTGEVYTNYPSFRNVHIHSGVSFFSSIDMLTEAEKAGGHAPHRPVYADMMKAMAEAGVKIADGGAALTGVVPKGNSPNDAIRILVGPRPTT